MQKYKLILMKESFYEDLVFALKILATINGEKKNHDVLLLLQITKDEEKNLGQLLKEENLEPDILILKQKELFQPSENLKSYNYIFTNCRIEIKESTPLQKIIFLAEYPCSNEFISLPNFNAAASSARNYCALK